MSFISVEYEAVSKLPDFPSVADLERKTEYSPLFAYLALAYISEKNLQADEIVYNVIVPYYPTEYSVNRILDLVYCIEAVGSEDILVSYEDEAEAVVLMQGRSISIPMFPVFAVGGKLVLTSVKPFALRYKAGVLTAECRHRCYKQAIKVVIGDKEYRAFQGELKAV